MLCPDRLVELASPSEEGPREENALRRNMKLYQAKGTCLCWLLLPHEHAVEIWRVSQPGPVERIDDAHHLDGGELAEGLDLDGTEICTA